MMVPRNYVSFRSKKHSLAMKRCVDWKNQSIVQLQKQYFKFKKMFFTFSGEYHFNALGEAFRACGQQIDKDVMVRLWTPISRFITAVSFSNNFNQKNLKIDF